MIVSHRINTLEQLKDLSPDEAIEFDVRDSNGKCVVEHDAFLTGLDFEIFLKAAGNRFLLVNIKSEGIEETVLRLLKEYGFYDFFLFDCSFPKIVELSKDKERRIAVRFSEYESIETVLTLKDKIEWIWVDSFHKFSLTRDIAKKIRDAGMKMCLVSPDLQKKPEDIPVYIQASLDNVFFFDAICCKRHNRHLWEQYYAKIKRPLGFLVYHQGWTDIVNCSALINYHAPRYETLVVMIKKSSEQLHRYLTKKYSHIQFAFFNTENYEGELVFMLNRIRTATQLPISEEDIHLIGLFDKFKLNFEYNRFTVQEYSADGELIRFEKKFYIACNIPYIVRTNYFSIQRDNQAETALYNKIIKSDTYIVTHLQQRNGITIKKEYLDAIQTSVSYELGGISASFFDAIKVLENAKEMHLIDSVWAAVCYHLDVKYRLFKHIPITVHCLRRHQQMFQEPVALPNWKFIDYEV